jgi:hypothetical protein
MADHGTATLQITPTPLGVTAYETGGGAINYGTVILQAVGGPPVTVPTAGQIWPRGNHA